MGDHGWLHLDDLKIAHLVWHVASRWLWTQRARLQLLEEVLLLICCRCSRVS